MDWNDLKYLIAVSEKGSLKAAARFMGVNHSTAWRRMQNLEDQLECQLFIADRKGYKLTESGQRILDNARKIESLADGIQQQTQVQRDEVKGLVRITAPGNVASEILPRFIAEFRIEYPEVEFEILEDAQSLNIHHREADIAIRASFSAPDNLIGRKMGEIRWGLYASEVFIGNEKLDIRLGAQVIQNAPIINYQQIESPAVRWFKDQTINNPKPITISTVEGAYQCALNSLGVALLPDVHSVKLEEIYMLPESFNSSLWLLANKDLRNTARIKAFWDFLILKMPVQLKGRGDI